MITKFFRSNSLLCFSPPIMIATVAIELGLAAWVAARFVSSSTKNLAIATLVCLGGFQLAEFSVCGGYGSGLIWSRLGYVLITLLPPLGLHLILRLQGRSAKFAAPAYLVAAGFIGAFAFAPSALNAAVCTGNYVIFSIVQPMNLIYNWSYGIVLVMGLIAATYGMVRSVGAVHQSLKWMIIGYLAFMIPSYAIYIIAPATHIGLPSIMCGFAVTLALILALKVIPSAIDSREPQILSGLKLNP